MRVVLLARIFSNSLKNAILQAHHNASLYMTTYYNLLFYFYGERARFMLRMYIPFDTF